MTPAETAADRARTRAVRMIYEHAFGDVPASYDDAQAAFAEAFTYLQAEWLHDLLKTVEKVTKAEFGTSPWVDKVLPALTADEFDEQTDRLVDEWLRDPEGPPAHAAGMRL